MRCLKIHIAFRIEDKPGGGGHQFLKALKKYLQSVHGYEEDAEKAAIILFNSHQFIDEVAKIKLRYPDKLLVHRIDGPMQLYNLINDKRDDVVFVANKYLADATIFQSAWSQEQNHRLGLRKNPFEVVIHNASEPSIFNRKNKKPFSPDRKIRLIAASWSANWNKGFKTYKWLDEYLDFNKYEMVFVGNSPVRFESIQHIPPLSNKDLAEKLKKNDIFIFASPIEACSNSLLEALQCGLPVIGADGSSNSELIGKGGETYVCPEEVPILIEKIAKNYSTYQANIRNPSMEEVNKQYYAFMTDVYKQIQSGKQKLKPFGQMGYFRIQTAIFLWKLSGHISGITGKFTRKK